MAFKLERGRIETYRTLHLMTAPFPTCEFMQLELSSRDCRFLRVSQSLCWHKGELQLFRR